MAYRLTVGISGGEHSDSVKVQIRNKAEAMGLVGEVQGGEDGFVVETEGEKPQLKELLNWLKMNAPFSHDTSVSEDWSAARGNMDRFRIH